MRQIVANLSIHCENFVAGSELAAFDGLSIGHDAFDEDSEGTARTVSAANDGESEGFLAGSFGEGDR